MTLKIVMIIAFRNFRDEEYSEPKAIFELAKFKVVTASSQLGVATGKLGLKQPIDFTLDQVQTSDYAAVLFVGGPGANVFYHDPQAQRIAKEAFAAGKIIGAICGAPPILSYAGILNGKRATMFMDTGDLAKGGAIYTDHDVEIDGKIITATGPKTADAWGQAIVKALNGK